MTTKRKRKHTHRRRDEMRAQDLAELAMYYDEHPTWGVLHIVLEDGNTDDSDVDWCIEQAIARKDKAGLKCARLIRRLHERDRLTVGRMAEEVARKANEAARMEEG